MENKQNEALYTYNSMGLYPLPRKDLENTTLKAIVSLSKW